MSSRELLERDRVDLIAFAYFVRRVSVDVHPERAVRMIRERAEALDFAVHARTDITTEELAQADNIAAARYAHHAPEATR